MPLLQWKAERVVSPQKLWESFRALRRKGREGEGSQSCQCHLNPLQMFTEFSRNIRHKVHIEKIKISRFLNFFTTSCGTTARSLLIPSPSHHSSWSITNAHTLRHSLKGIEPWYVEIIFFFIFFFSHVCCFWDWGQTALSTSGVSYKMAKIRNDSEKSY